ncbi:MAG: efflux RND transporter periplasmic adaptor subunit [Rhodospirillales bacterium]|nr:efflux RND transporter periplasmic adaptor subunit [Rhodospirillales bacterium]HJO72572.1 efflux RND transporter periplasmic adaptor subunit [Rhodospirillales bacterium]
MAGRKGDAAPGRSMPKAQERDLMQVHHLFRDAIPASFASALCRLAAAAIMAAAGWTTALPATAQNSFATPVGVDEVRREPLSQTVPVIGRLVARQAGVVAARARGPVAEIRIDVGDKVDKGAIIAVLVADRLHWERQLRAAQVAEAEAALTTAKTETALKTQELKRMEGLRKSSAFTQARYDDALQEVAKARSAAAEVEASRAQARANLKLAEIDLRYAKIRAPFPGVVSMRHTEVGSYLNVGDPVITLIDDQRLEIEADVPAERISGLEAGAVVSFRIDGSSLLRATVRAVIPEENPMTRTRAVRFTPNFGGRRAKLATNQSATLHLPVGTARTVMTVHKDAILNRADKTVVFVVAGEKAQMRPVRLGDAVGGRFEVLSGLDNGDLVVVRGNERLRPGQKIRFGSDT